MPPDTSHLCEEDAKVVAELLTPELDQLLMDDNATGEQLEAAIKHIKNPADFMILARAYVPIQGDRDRKPREDEDVYCMQQGDATVQQYKAAEEIVLKEHRKQNGVEIMITYQQHLGMIFYCPKGVVVIDPKDEAHRGLFVQKTAATATG